MKIVAIAHFYMEENAAGGEKMLHGLLKSLVDAGHDVTCLVTDTVRLNSVVEGVKIIYGATAKNLDTYESDVVLTHFQNGDAAFNYCQRTGKPLVYIVHNNMRATKRMVYSIRNGLLVFNTNWIKDECTFKAPSLVVHPPINRPTKAQNDPEGYISLVNLHPQKGSQLFYELARNNPDRKFLGVKGGYFKAQQQIMQLPNVGIIEMTQDIQNDVYAKSRIVLMPSSYESFGMVAAEAIANKIPVITTDTAGLKENLGEAGLYAPYGDVRGFQSHIDALDDPKYYKAQQAAVFKQSKTINQEDELKRFVEAVEKLHAV